MLNCSLRHSSFSSLSLLELFLRFLDDLVFLSPSSESEDKRDRFKLRRFFVDQLGGSALSSSLDVPILSGYRICYPQRRINLAGKQLLQFNFAHEQLYMLHIKSDKTHIFSPWKCHVTWFSTTTWPKTKSVRRRLCGPRCLLVKVTDPFDENILFILRLRHSKEL